MGLVLLDGETFWLNELPALCQLVRAMRAKPRSNFISWSDEHPETLIAADDELYSVPDLLLGKVTIL